ncbi:hypothetical protein HYC85_019038 [Camellia sinensis]|uniref:Thioredoxin domain-containing protein n=1 Tax=Camellia sinensis TaxID=4442 RepID=A0A7J7GYA0_CAMSI|nr:hypothetical protein HYC85_019038 [Camellia sinensis]
MVHAVGGNEFFYRGTGINLPGYTLFLTVDVDDVKEVATKYEIKAMPTFLLMKDGAQVDKIVGANPDEKKKRTEGLVQSTRVCGLVLIWCSLQNMWILYFCFKFGR